MSHGTGGSRSSAHVSCSSVGAVEFPLSNQCVPVTFRVPR